MGKDRLEARQDLWVTHQTGAKRRLIRPEHPLPLDPELYSGRIDTASLISMGYDDAKRYLRNRNAEGLPFEPETTHMTDGALGISFREQMSGGFAMDESDPAEGQRKGKAAGQALTLHAAVEIDDLRRFETDPDHTGRLAGTIDFAPLGVQIPGKNGVFNLFSPTDQPGLKLMVYELGFESGGKEYYFAGAKQVHKDTGFDLWTDTTTLFSRLHLGKDKSGPVVGAGILTLGVGDLVKLTSTIRVTNARNAAESLQAIGEFSHFFLGELADTYLKPAPAGPSGKPGA